MLVTAGGDDKICIFAKKDPSSGDSLPSFDMVACKEGAHFSDVNCATFHPKENIIATAGDDNYVKIWSLTN